MRDDRLLLFYKHPAPGRVKTRLAAAIGPAAAAEVHRRCVELTLAALAPLRSVTTLMVSPATAIPLGREWLGPDFRFAAQQGGTLGERLAAGFAAAFAGGARRVAAIGADSPWITPRVVADAFTALAQHDVAVGPAADGGYYLIAMRRPRPELFVDVAWGTGRVLEQTAANAERCNASLARLANGYDVDTLPDLERFLRSRSDSGGTALEAMRRLLEPRRMG